MGWEYTLLTCSCCGQEDIGRSSTGVSPHGVRLPSHGASLLVKTCFSHTRYPPTLSGHIQGADPARRPTGGQEPRDQGSGCPGSRPESRCTGV